MTGNNVNKTSINIRPLRTMGWLSLWTTLMWGHKNTYNYRDSVINKTLKNCILILKWTFCLNWSLGSNYLVYIQSLNKEKSSVEVKYIVHYFLSSSARLLVWKPNTSISGQLALAVSPGKVGSKHDHESKIRGQCGPSNRSVALILLTHSCSLFNR